MTFSRITKRFYFIPLFMTAVLFVGCQNNEKQEAATEVEAATPEITLEQKKQQLQRVSPNSSSTNNNAAMGSNINPPHGQPGHRCDVPVGAPLDGGSSNNQQPIRVSPSSNTATPANSSPIASPTINPPHGQPGHRCDVKVGDPLPTS